MTKFKEKGQYVGNCYRCGIDLYVRTDIPDLKEKQAEAYDDILIKCHKCGKQQGSFGLVHVYTEDIEWAKRVKIGLDTNFHFMTNIQDPVFKL